VTSRAARALVVEHSIECPAANAADWLTRAGLELETVRPYVGDPLPDRVTQNALIVLGGPQTAYDDASAPWIGPTKELLARTVAEGIPVLGICLGGHLLAEALGGVVERGESGPEVGARLVAKRDVAGADPLVWDTPMSWITVQWHWDAITELPPGAVLLASSPRYENQMFRVGDRAWGMQFHPEPTAEVLGLWVESDRQRLADDGLSADGAFARALPELPEIADLWEPVFARFAAVVRGEDPRPTQLPLA
jgi:GMP synthase-like glutamine amidotransferase